MTGHMVSGKSREGSDLTLGCISLLKRWSNTGTDFPEWWLISQACQHLKEICNFWLNSVTSEAVRQVLPNKIFYSTLLYFTLFQYAVTY